MKIKMLAAIAITLFTFSSCRLESAMKTISRKARQEVRANHNYENNVEEWGEVTDKEIEELLPFTQIQVNGNIDIVFTQDSTLSVRMHGNKKAVEAYKYWWDEDKIVFNTQEGFTYDATKDNANVDKNTPAITLYITAPSLEALTAYGASDMTIESGFHQAEALMANIYGMGKVKMDNVSTGDLTVNVDGMGDVEMKSMQCTGNSRIIVNGTGDIKGSINCGIFIATVNGVGNIDLDTHCSELKTECNGAGSITLKGECQLLYDIAESSVVAVDVSKLVVKRAVSAE